MIDVTSLNNLGQLVREAAQRYSDKTSLRFEEKTLSFTDLETRTQRLANALNHLGIRKGDRVAVMLPNIAEFPVTWLALATCGAIMVPINIQYQHDDLRYVLGDSGAKLLVTLPEFLTLAQSVKRECSSLERITVFADGATTLPDDVLELYSLMSKNHSSKLSVTIEKNDLLNLQYTSGTTGFPKGCMLSHAYWLELGQRAVDIFQMSERDVDFTVQPFYYMDPQWNLVACLLTGIPLVVAKKFSASKFWATVQREGVSLFYCLGTIPILLYKQPQNPELERSHHLRVVYCSGIYPPLHAAFEERYGAPWREVFGMTETGVDLFVALSDSSSVGSGTVGKPISTKRVQIVTDKDESVLANQVGELCIQGGVMMQSYWRNPEATARAFQGGWLHTGDLAYQDARGNVFLVGRVKDMIRRSGENIAASEVEAALLEHPAVLAAAVVAVPDEVRGEEAKAFIQRKESCTVAPTELLTFLSKKLAVFKQPRYIAFVDTFPLTPSERIAKYKLTEADNLYSAKTFDSTTQEWSDS
jgi:acyl-CoA synthetase (AMP-forming)/AMP-acid ligase II